MKMVNFGFKMTMTRSRTLIVFILFAIAMAFLESAVVTYLRALYYPDGFAFPLKVMNPSLALTELIREAATMIMLVTVALITGRTKMERLAFFLLAFAIWDIFYYIFLKLIVGWPGSLLTWDILFLIPTPWVGPVITPVINSLTMIILASFILRSQAHDEKTALKAREWFLLIGGSLIILASYTEECIRFITGHFRLADILTASGNSEIMHYVSGFVPHHFNWYLFSTGVVLQMAAIISYAVRTGMTVSSHNQA
jgi:hypothetical protein